MCVELWRSQTCDSNLACFKDLLIVSLRESDKGRRASAALQKVHRRTEISGSILVEQRARPDKVWPVHEER